MSKENRGDAPLPIDDWLTSWENEGKSIGAPMVFISYAYATPEHCQWVKRLSDKLRNDGVNTVIDKYLPGGYDLAQFMGKAPLWPGVKYIVCVCSSLYTQKATNGTGGVGYEKMIVNRELAKQTNTNKFIPILRDNPEGETPDFLGTRFYCDFREDADFETTYQQLLKDILGLPKAPPLGNPRKMQTLDTTPPSEPCLTRLDDEQYKGLTAKEPSFDVAQLSGAELELLVAVLLRKTPVTYQANKLEFHINDNTVVPFTFDTPLPENHTVNNVLKSLIALNFLEKLGALYRASRLAQEYRDELIARDNKRILDVLLRTSFGKLVLEYADGKAARISVNVSKTWPCDKCNIVLQKNGDFEHPQPGFNISTKIALAHEVNAVAVILHKNLLINNWEAQENAGTPPYSQRNLSENGGFPTQTDISPYSGQLIRSGINARNFFSRSLKFDYVTSRLTERGCEISRLYLAWNQGDN